jgi:hypothetical protein
LAWGRFTLKRIGRRCPQRLNTSRYQSWTTPTASPTRLWDNLGFTTRRSPPGASRMPPMFKNIEPLLLRLTLLDALFHLNTMLMLVDEFVWMEVNPFMDGLVAWQRWASFLASSLYCGNYWCLILKPLLNLSRISLFM